MDRVKKCWQGILKEREDFWSSFFIKYEEDKKDVDFRSYMDNSSTRVNTLLELASEDNEESEASKGSDKKVIQYFEEQSSESSESHSNEVTTSLNENQEQEIVENLKLDELSVISVKKTVPTLVLEAIPEEENAQYFLPRNSPNSVNKLISVESSQGSDSTVLQYFEEQSSESSEAYSDEATIPLNEEKEEQKVENVKPVQLPVVLVKKIVPTFALEVNPEKDDAKNFLPRNSHSPQKFISEAFNCSDFKELQDLEELSSESSEPYTHEVTTQLNGDQEEQKVEILKPAKLPVVLMKRSVPTFVLEVNPKEEMAKCLLSRNSHSAKKFKLFESSPPHPKENVEDSMIDDQYQSFSVNCNSTFLNESIASTVSDDDSFKKLICRRIKPTRKHVSNPKRFKLM